MLLAELESELILPIPNKKAKCPACKELVYSRCGDINVWHWAHDVKCKFESEPETVWHKKWKGLAILHGCSIEYVFKNHITDAVDVKNKCCYEFQYSPISKIDIISRAMEYKSFGFDVKWVFDFCDKAKNEQLDVAPIDKSTVKFKQRWAKKTISDVFLEKSTLFGVKYFDVCDSIILVKKLYENGNGWGYIVNNSDIFGRGVI